MHKRKFSIDGAHAMKPSRIFMFNQISRCKQQGFTLLELMITISVAGILAAVAIPSMQDFVVGQRVKSMSFDLISTFMFARSESIKRNESVYVKALSDDWTQGWCVMSANTTCSPTSPSADVIRANKVSAVSVSVTWKTTAGTITFNRSGRLSSGTSTVQLELDDTKGYASVTPRCITLSTSGTASSKAAGC